MTEVTLIRAENLRPGHLIDLERDPYADPGPDYDPSFESELAEVHEVVRETATCILVHTSMGSYGFPPDHDLPVEVPRP